MICIGYAGYEAYDVILYIGRTLTKLNCRVLIIDLADSGALWNSINNGMDLNSYQEIVNYRNINYTRKVPAKDELNMFEDGVVFVVYGDKNMEDSPIECSTLNVVVNTFPHIIQGVNRIIQKAEVNEMHCKLLIRDVVTIDDVARVKRSMELCTKIERISYLYWDIADCESAVECQITQVVRFTNVTARMEKYILEQIHDMFPALTTNRIKKAIAAARKGA